MLSISNFGSSTNFQSSSMHAYLKKWAMPPVPNQNPVACNSMQPNGMLNRQNRDYESHKLLVELK